VAEDDALWDGRNAVLHRHRRRYHVAWGATQATSHQQGIHYAINLVCSMQEAWSDSVIVDVDDIVSCGLQTPVMLAVSKSS
jgi:hypothetical protein